jgi:predicted TPR repeat methyltransferase
MPSNSDAPDRPFDGSLSLDSATELARGMHKAGLVQAAEEIYRRILAAAPKYVDAIHLLGLACYQQGRRDEGIATVRRAVAMAPEHADALNNLGNMLLEQDQLAEATEAYQRVLTFRPNHADAHSNVGTVLRRRDDLVGAEAHFRRAIELDPEHGVAHHNLGSILRDTGRPEEALGWFQRALLLRPYDGESYRRVGATLYALGRVTEATRVYERWTVLEPKNPAAHHMLAACSGQNVPVRASDAYVQQTFDSFSASFDSVLEKLKYRAPALVADAVATALGEPRGTLDVLDAGAGTGLCGPLLRPFARRLVGVDLSPKMLEKAKVRNTYDVLDAAELTAYMRDRPAAFDLVVSADTLVYFGDLGEAMAAAARTLRSGGHLVFTVEQAPADLGPPGYLLIPHGRYGHSEAHVRATLTAAGLTVVAINRAHLRLENKVPVDGFVVTARYIDPSELAVAQRTGPT